MTVSACARRLLLVAFCILASALAAQTVTVSPSSVNQGEEVFAQVSLSTLLATDSALVTFTGPAGTAALDPQTINDGFVIVWVPESAMNDPGSYSVYLDVTRSGATTRYGPGQLTVNVAGSTPFSLTLPEVMSVAATGPSGALVTFSATSSDATPVTCTPSSGSTFPIGTTTVNCSANNGTSSASGSFPVVVQDTSGGSIPFSLNLPEVVTAEATSSSGAVVTFSATSSDGTAVTCTPASGSVFALGATTVNCSANSATGSFTVFVHDTVGPVLSLPADITTSNPVVTYTATATDAIDPAPAVECTPPSGATFAAGTTVVQCLATDQHANSTSDTFRVTVNADYLFSQSTYQVNTAAGQTVTYTSVLPAAATETLVIRNGAGTVVRTLVNASRSAGTYNDAWNGRDDSGALLPDGPYSFVVTITEGSNVRTFDFGNEMRGTTQTQLPYPSCSAKTMPLDTCSNNAAAGRTYDLLANDPLKIHYSVAEPSRVSVVLTDVVETSGTCTGGEICVINDEYRPSGSYEESWAGVLPHGSYAPARSKLTVVRRTSTFPRNVVLLYGSGAPAGITNLTLTPTVYSPEAGSMKIEFDLATFGNVPATVTFQLIRQESASTLRGITLSSQSPGHVTYTWDGKADSGHWLAPGEYSLIVTATAHGRSSVAHSRFVILY